MGDSAHVLTQAFAGLGDNLDPNFLTFTGTATCILTYVSLYLTVNYYPLKHN